MYLCIYLLSFIVHFTRSTVNDYLDIKSGLERVYPESMALRFFIIVNNTGEDCDLECMPDRCCLEMEGGEDCSILEIMGRCFESIPRGEIRTIKLAAPLVNPFDRRGYCVVHLDSKPEGRGVFRNTVKIPFETTFSDSPTVTPCPNVDQDPFNDCKPVDCETYYNGQRPYYDKRLQRCVEAPSCIKTDSEEAVYDAKSNRCNRNYNVTNEDLNYLNKRTNVKDQHRPAKDILIIKNKAPISGDRYTKEKFNNIPLSGYRVTKYNSSCNLPLFNKISKYFSYHVNALVVLVFLITVQCCLIITMIYCMSKGCNCNKDKTVISRFFNYRQDVSVTTPLISIGKTETETTCQFLSDSSMNVNKKIKCYKACHKDKLHNAKFSMSDDILSKCVNRRDWTHKPRSEVIHEFNTETWNKGLQEVASQKLSKTEIKASVDKVNKVKKNESKVLFENENSEKFTSENKPKLVKSIIKRNIDDENTQPSSEKEIQCYSYEEAGSAGDGQAVVNTASLSTEKGAQAYFSNDSIDDFLSERGMIFLSGENVSKYTFSTGSSHNVNLNKSSSGISGKTSKNNLVKNLISMIHRKSKHGPSSDPEGGKKTSGNLDLELLHMSQASVFSSNASEIIGLKKNVDSRSSM